MTKIAYLFPGQGSQSAGMGANLYETSVASRRVFDEADRLLGYPISAYCFEGPEETLRQTLYTQPALFVTSVAALRALQEAGAQQPSAAAGHSIGEYAALVCAGSLTLETGLALVRRRAEEMNRAAELEPGAMAAPLGLSAELVEAACREAELSGAGIVDVANYNCPGQAVISGTPAAVEKASELSKASGARKVSVLNVSGAFHSRLMTSAAEAMQAVLKDADIHDVEMPVVANLTAEYQKSGDEIRHNLAAQIDHSVKWEQSILCLHRDGFDTFVEVGPGKVLTGLLKRIIPEAAYFNVSDSASLNAYLLHSQEEQ